jgi:hypothetical protein
MSYQSNAALQERLQELRRRGDTLFDKAAQEGRGLLASEQRDFDKLSKEIAEVADLISRRKAMNKALAEMLGWGSRFLPPRLVRIRVILRCRASRARLSVVVNPLVRGS